MPPLPPMTTDGCDPTPSDRGAAVIEMALVSSLLLYLVLGGLSLGVLLGRAHTLRSAAGEAARAAATTDDDPDTPTDERVARALASIGAQPGIGTCGGALTCSVAVEPCGAEPAAPCLHVHLAHDRAADPIVAPLPLLENVLPPSLTADAVAVTPGSV